MNQPIFIDKRKKKRPELLSLLCILTFIGSGLQLFSNLFLAFNKDYILENKDKINFDFEDLLPIMELPDSFFLLNCLFFFFSIAGAILMWNLKRIGFHVYSLAQIALLFILSLYNPINSAPIVELLVTSVFIFLYYRNLKFMK